MFFRSKKGNGRSADAQPAGDEGGVAKRVPKVSATPSKAAQRSSAEVSTSPPNTTTKPLAPEELKKRAEASKRVAATMGEIIGLMARSPRHRDYKLADVRWLVVPAVRTGQYSLATAQSKSQGYTAPVAAVLWASVSAEVDKRIANDLSVPIRLAPREWNSGDILWIIDTVGDNRMVGEVVRRLQEAKLKGKIIKARVLDAQKQAQIRTIEPRVSAASSK